MQEPTGSSVTKKTAHSYASYTTGLVSAVQEWGFYTGSSPTFPSVPDRATYITYYSTGTNNINRPASVTLCSNSGSDSACSGGGSKVSQTLITYDSYGSGLASISGATNHDDTGFSTSNPARGNPTQVQQWVAGNTYLTTSYTYDTTGQVTSTTDPAGHTTHYSYADRFYNDNGQNPPSPYSPAQATNAFLTSVTYPNGGVESHGYYYGSGKEASVTDPNSATTYFHFLDPMDRATSTIAPAGWEIATYTSPTQTDIYKAVGDTTPSTSCSSCQHTTLLLDSWGRQQSQILANNPGGPTEVDTAYDGAGRVIPVSHPYLSGGTPVYETTTYDALDRVTKATHADGQSRITSYGTPTLTAQQYAGFGLGYPITVQDETGHTKEEWTDGFGRIVEVDEPTSNLTSAQKTLTINRGGDSSMIYDPCAQAGYGTCPYEIDNRGSVSVTVGGYTATYNHNSSDTQQTVAQGLASQLNSPDSPVIATANGNQMIMTAVTPGGNANYSFSTSNTYDNTEMCGSSPCFSGPGFWLTPITGSLSGGSGSVVSTSYAYNAGDKLTQVVQGSQTRYHVYDGLGRLTSVTTPEAETDSLFYDSDSACSGSYPGQLVKKLDARGVRTCYQYNDPLSRLTQKSYSDGTPTVTYAYDQGGAPAFALGALTSMSDGTGSTT